MKTIISATLTIALSAAMGVTLLDGALSSIEAREQAVTAVYVDSGMHTSVSWAGE